MKNKYIKILIIMFSLFLLFSSNIKLYADENNKTICNYTIDITKDYKMHVKGEINFYNKYAYDNQEKIYINSPLIKNDNKIKNFKIITNLAYKKKYNNKSNKYELDINFPPGMSKIEYQYDIEILKDNVSYFDYSDYNNVGIFFSLFFNLDVSSSSEKNIKINLVDAQSVKIVEENNITYQEITPNTIILKGNETSNVRLQFPRSYFVEEPKEKKEYNIWKIIGNMLAIFIVLRISLFYIKVIKIKNKDN